MGRWLAAGALLWPVLLGTAVDARARGDATWPDLVYLVSAHICHQRPERSFRIADTPWPVCARCLGLYLAAPLGALAALPRSRARRDRVRIGLAIASLPTLATLAVEHAGIGVVTNVQRFAAAVPLGVMIAFALVHVAGGRPKSIE